jgi:hypothetical protein
LRFFHVVEAKIAVFLFPFSLALDSESQKRKRAHLTTDAQRTVVFRRKAITLSAFQRCRLVLTAGHLALFVHQEENHEQQR